MAPLPFLSISAPSVLVTHISSLCLFTLLLGSLSPVSRASCPSIVSRQGFSALTLLTLHAWSFHAVGLSLASTH